MVTSELTSFVLLAGLLVLNQHSAAAATMGELGDGSQ
jgi:hypothetical protein